MSTLHDVVTHPLFSILTALVGFFFGHRIALWRDRRREFNQVAEPIFAALTKERRRPSPFTSEPSDTDFDVFRRYLSAWQVSSFDDSVAAYRSARESSQKRSPDGGVFYDDTSSIIAAIDRLLAFTKRR